MSIGFVKVFCEHDESYRIKHPDLPCTINWIEVCDGTICWASELVSVDENKKVEKRFLGFSRMSEREIDMIIDDLNKDFLAGKFKNHKPKRM